MKKFLILAHGEMDHSPEAREAHQQWWSSIQDSVVDPGSPLLNGRDVSRTGDVSELSEQVDSPLGYSILQAESIEAAVALVIDAPMDVWVYEAMPM